MSNNLLSKTFKSIQVPMKLWRKLERVSSNAGLTRNLILRIGFCYEIETTKGLSNDVLPAEKDMKIISKEVLFGDHSQLFFDLFYVYIKDSEMVWNETENNKELEIFKKLILSGGDHICNLLLENNDSDVLENLKKLITEDN